LKNYTIATSQIKICGKKYATQRTQYFRTIVLGKTPRGKPVPQMRNILNFHKLRYTKFLASHW
jgi:hypothetical protein